MDLVLVKDEAAAKKGFVYHSSYTQRSFHVTCTLFPCACADSSFDLLICLGLEQVCEQAGWLCQAREHGLGCAVPEWAHSQHAAPHPWRHHLPFTTQKPEHIQLLCYSTGVDRGGRGVGVVCWGWHAWNACTVLVCVFRNVVPQKNDCSVFSSARGRHVHNTSPLPHGHHTQVSLEVKPAAFQNLLEPFFLNELVWCLSSQLNLGLWVRFMRSAGWNTGEAVTKKSYLST